MQIIKDLTEEDLYEMRKSLEWKEISLSQLKKGLQNTEYKVSIFENNNIVACGRIISDYSCKGVLSDVLVKKEFQGKGYGKMVLKTLFEMVESNLKDNEKFQIEATPTSGNRNFYVKCGMKYRPERMDGTYMWIEKK